MNSVTAASYGIALRHGLCDVMGKDGVELTARLSATKRSIHCLTPSSIIDGERQVGKQVSGMSVMVYPRLGEVLASKNVTVPELERKIKEQFGLSVKPEALYWLLLDEEPVRQVDLQVVGAAAAALGVALDDLFAVETAPNGTSTEANKPVLGARDSRRLAQLLDKQGRESLSDTESEELEALVAKYRHLLHERRLGEIARQRGISVEQARREAEVQVDETLRWWRAFSADPQRRQGVADQVKRRRARQAE